MKRINIGFTLSFVMLLLVACSSTKNSGASASDIEAIVNSRNFIFVPLTVSPLRGGTRNIDFNYDLRIKKDSIVSYLPYFGRATNVNYGATDGGLNFTSTKFDYTTEPRKKGGWEITIVPKDVNEPRQMNLTVTTSGSATLNVTSNNRDAISFNGSIKAAKN